jgi:hypothetical protein
MRPKLSPGAERWVALLLVGVALTLCLVFFERLPIENTSLAIDWKGLWQGIRGGQLRYGNATGLRIAPWDALLALPLGWLSFRASWGVLTLLTVAVLMLSVPPHPRPRWRWVGVLLLVTSFPALRLIADGNFEALIIGGVLLLVMGYARQQVGLLAAGILLATAKVQETWMLMLVLGVYLLQTWPVKRWLTLGGVLALVVVPCLLALGPAWVSGMAAIAERGSIMDVSLGAALNRLGLPLIVVGLGWMALAGATLVLAWFSGRDLSREKAAMLIAASLLLSPYAAGNSYLTVLAIGVLPIFFARPWLGGLLLALSSLPYFANRDLLFYGQAYYWTALLLLTWGVLAWQVRRASIKLLPTTPK